MEKRRLGRTGHMSTVAIFGGAAFWEESQAEADAIMQQVLAAGVNHIDVAPSYGKAEDRLAPWMPGIRDQIFLGCKTLERTREGAADGLRRSLERLQVEKFDLFQIHAITKMEELDRVMRPGGALDAIMEAREQGLTKYIGITGHGDEGPKIFREALRRFDFDTVLFPINFVEYANPEYRRESEALVEECKARDVGTMIIKAVGKGPWRGKKTYSTWYEPFDDMGHIQQGVNFTLSQDVTGLCMAGDIRILPTFLKACESYRRLSAAEQEELIASGAAYESVFALGGPG